MKRGKRPSSSRPRRKSSTAATPGTRKGSAPRERTLRGKQTPQRVRSSRGATASPAPFRLPGECTVAEADTLKSNLAALLREPRMITLDIAELQRIDTAGMQVVAAFVRERAQHGLMVQWQGDSASFASAAKLLGLTADLKLRA